jgi:hypothetical protein
MDPAELQQRLRHLTKAHPGEHPDTVALSLQAAIPLCLDLPG